jgi:hypothetical protein
MAQQEQAAPDVLTHYEPEKQTAALKVSAAVFILESTLRLNFLAFSGFLHVMPDAQRLKLGVAAWHD